MDNNVLVSVCIITYNHFNYIEDSINSVLNQKTNFDFEIVIADDFSTDGTRDILLEFKKKYPEKIKLILQEKNIGPARNWKCLLEYPKSKYVAYFEGDDYWINNNKLQIQIDLLETNIEFAGSYHNVYIINESGLKDKKQLFRDELPDEITAINTITSIAPFHTSSFVYRNKFMEFPEGILNLFSGDMVLFSIIAKHGKLVKVPGVMSVYRKHNNSVTGLNSDQIKYHKRRIELIKFLDKFHNFEFKEKSKNIINFHKKSIKEVKFRPLKNILLRTLNKFGFFRNKTLIYEK